MPALFQFVLMILKVSMLLSLNVIFLDLTISKKIVGVVIFYYVGDF